MATGSRIDLFLAAPIPNRAAALPSAGALGRTIGLQHPRLGGNGVSNQTRPNAIRSLPLNGVAAPTYFNDFYNRVHIVPLAIDFGAIASNVTGIASIWNAYFNPVTLSAIASENADGVTLDGPTAPYVAKALEILRYNVNVSAIGLPTVNAAFTFQFGGLAPVRIPVYAIRALLWPYAPNWSNGYTVTIDYKTDTTVSRSGIERRRALRQNPRKSIEFTSLATGEQLRAFNQLMMTWQNRTFFLPEIPRCVESTQSMASGTFDMPVDRTPDWLVTGQSVMLLDGIVSDLRRIQSVIGNVVTFTSQGLHTWPIGTRLHPALEGQLNAETVANGLTNSVATIAVRFDVRPTSELALTNGVPTTVFNGREVFLRKPNWAQPVETTHAFPSEIVDFGRGAIRRFRPIDFQSRYRKATFLGRTSDDAGQIEAFFRRMKGQRGEFYMPTGEQDLPLKFQVLPNTNSLRTNGPYVARAWTNDKVNRCLTVQFQDGRRLFGKVISVIEVNDIDGHDSIVSIGVSWPYGFLPSEVTLISWMPVWRHATDSLTTEWLTDSVAQIALSLRTIPDLEPE